MESVSVHFFISLNCALFPYKTRNKKHNNHEKGDATDHERPLGRLVYHRLTGGGQGTASTKQISRKKKQCIDTDTTEVVVAVGRRVR